MPSIKIEGVPPYNGEYEIDLNFTNREFHTIKEISGVRAGDLEDALEHRDLDLVVALAVNALRRTGQVVNIDALWDATAGKITLVGDEADAVPPPQPTGSASEPPDSSGTSGNETGESGQESDPSSTGTQG